MWYYSIWYFRDMKCKSDWPLWFGQNILNSYSSGSSRFATIMPADTNRDRWRNWCRHNGRFRLSVSTVNRSYELTGITHVTPFRKYGKHSTGPSTYGSWVRTYSKLFSCKFVLTVCSYRAQANEICTYGRVSRGSLPRVRRPVRLAVLTDSRIRPLRPKESGCRFWEKTYSNAFSWMRNHPIFNHNTRVYVRGQGPISVRNDH